MADAEADRHDGVTSGSSPRHWSRDPPEVNILSLPMSPTEGEALHLCMLSPWPSWPNSLFPQLQAWPVSSTTTTWAASCPLPTILILTSFRASILFGSNTLFFEWKLSSFSLPGLAAFKLEHVKC